jgi:hypothetical protein
MAGIGGRSGFDHALNHPVHGGRIGETCRRVTAPRAVKELFSKLSTTTCAGRRSWVGCGEPKTNFVPMKNRLSLCLAIILAAPLFGAETLTYVDLIKRLTDLERLAVLPAPGEACAQWSSYDRKSRYDEAAGKYVAWDANGDGNGIIRKEGDKSVFAEMEGPGCIWRIWSAAPKEGHVQIYLDGATEPAVDLPFMAYFDKKNAPFTRSALVHTTARGWNNYVPIPYQKSCKIVADANWGNYFHFNYATYPKGTVVPTFKRELTPEENAALDRANVILSNGEGHAPSVGRATTRRNIKLAAGRTTKLNTPKGPAAITAIRAKLALPPSPQDRTVLRELAIRIKWDGEATPSVWAPFGDFFGTAAGANPYRSLPSGLTKDGNWYCYWHMPYAKSAELEIINEGKETRDLEIEVESSQKLSRPIEQLGRFHAKWHRDVFPPAEKERAIDWTMLKTEGRGRFVGVMLHVWNPKGGWWGEGDEKFFVDGEKFPSTIGTGSEDYFGYAWGDPALFENAYHNQTISMGNKGHICVNRWHITDNVPFQKSFEGCIEKYFSNNRPTLFASTVYWYLAPGGKDPHTEAPVAERANYWSAALVGAVKGALEGEQLKILSKTAGDAREQDLSDHTGNWSNGSHLWWTGAKPGDKLELAVPVKTAGTYKLVVQLTKARDYGIVQLSLDGRKLGEPIDLYNNGVIPAGPLDLGTRDFSTGQHVLTAEITGANPAAVKAYMFGLDYVLLEKR